MKKQKGIFTKNFVGIETDDGVAGVFIIKQRKGNTIDFDDEMNQIEFRDVNELNELIEMLEKGIEYLKLN